MKLRFIIAVLAGAFMATTSYGAAATVDVRGGSLQAGIDDNLACQDNILSLRVAQVVRNGNVVVVEDASDLVADDTIDVIEVSNIDEACNVRPDRYEVFVRVVGANQTASGIQEIRDADGVEDVPVDVDPGVSIEDAEKFEVILGSIELVQ